MPKIDKDYVDKWLDNGIDITTRVIYLGPIRGDDPGDEETEEPGIYWNTSRRIIKGIHTLDTNAQCGRKPITIIMNSCGGDWDHGMAIYNAIKYAKNHVTIINMSQATSMTSVIFQAGDYRITSPDGVYMIHDGCSNEGNGSPKSNKNWADYEINVVQPRMYQIYLDRIKETDKKGNFIVDEKIAIDILNSKLPKGSVRINARRGLRGITLSHIEQLCSLDTIFTPDEMIKLNFADRKLEDNDLAGAYVNDAMHGLPTGLDSLEESDEND